MHETTPPPPARDRAELCPARGAVSTSEKQPVSVRWSCWHPFLPVLLLFGIKIPSSAGRVSVSIAHRFPIPISKPTSRWGHRQQALRPKRHLYVPRGTHIADAITSLDDERDGKQLTNPDARRTRRMGSPSTRSACIEKDAIAQPRRPIHDAFVQQRFPRRGGYEHGKMGCGCCMSVALRVEMTFLNPPQAGTRDRDHLSQRKKAGDKAESGSLSVRRWRTRAIRLRSEIWFLHPVPRCRFS